MMSLRLLSLLAVCSVLIGCNMAGFPPLGWSSAKHGGQVCHTKSSGDLLSEGKGAVVVEAGRGSSCRAIFTFDSRENASRMLTLGAMSVEVRGDVSVQIRAFDGKRTVGRATFRFGSQEVDLGKIVEVELPEEFDLVVVSFLAENEARIDMKGISLRSSVSNRIGEEGPQAIYDEAMALIKAHALAYEAVSADEIEAARPPKGATMWQARSAIKGVLRNLGDNHSFLVSPDGVSEADRISRAEIELATWKMLRPGVAVVNVPMFRGSESDLKDRYVTGLRGALRSGSDAGAKAWIVDLSSNRGGNMWPMLRGLEPLLGDSDLGSFRYRDGTLSPWVLEARSESDAVPDLRGVAVAVVTSRRTASSGEAVAVAFKGRPMTKSFGSPSSGYSTSNTTYKLADGSRMYLTTAVFVDRDGNAYGGKLMPDEETNGLSSEGAVHSAGVWLDACLHGDCIE